MASTQNFRKPKDEPMDDMPDVKPSTAFHQANAEPSFSEQSIPSSFNPFPDFSFLNPSNDSGFVPVIDFMKPAPADEVPLGEPLDGPVLPQPLAQCYIHPVYQPAMLPSIIPSNDARYIVDQDTGKPLEKTDFLKKKKMQLYDRDLKNLSSRIQLVEYILKQGSDSIPATEEKLKFNAILDTKRGIIGANELGHVACYNHDELESYICLMCQFWTTAFDMFKHLKSDIHRMNYMKMHHNRKRVQILSEKDPTKRRELVEELVEEIITEEGVQHCKTRMRTVLNQPAIARIWSEYFDFVSDDWKNPNYVMADQAPGAENGKVLKDEYGEDQDIKPIINHVSASKESQPSTAKTPKQPKPQKFPVIDLEDGEVLDSDEDCERPPESPCQPTSMRYEPTDFVKSEVKKCEPGNQALIALVLIRHEFHANKQFNRGLIEMICRVVGVSPSDVFEEEALKAVAERLDSKSLIVLRQIACYYLTESSIMPLPAADAPTSHPTTILIDLGIEKEVLIPILRDISEEKLNKKQVKTEAPEKKSLNEIERDKHGSIIHRNYVSEIDYKNIPLTVRPPKPEKSRYHPYAAPSHRVKAEPKVEKIEF